MQAAGTRRRAESTLILSIVVLITLGVIYLVNSSYQFASAASSATAIATENDVQFEREPAAAVPCEPQKPVPCDCPKPSLAPSEVDTGVASKVSPATKQTTFVPERRLYVESVIQQVMSKQITMVSPERMANVRDSAMAVIEQGIEGDFVETGTWQGGCSLVMRAVNKVYGDTSRRANWLFDTFEGLPGFDERDNKVEQSIDSTQQMDPAGSYKFAGGLETVQKHFVTILGDNFKNLNFEKGFFKDTVPVAAVKKIAVLRLDGDMYSSTMDVLNVFYDKVSSGGYIIIDDYGHWPQCKKAIHDFFDEERGMDIAKLLKKVDYTGYYFIKP